MFFHPFRIHSHRQIGLTAIFDSTSYSRQLRTKPFDILTITRLDLIFERVLADLKREDIRKTAPV